nr:hypothetical protein [Bacteroidota bacterium]
MLGGPPGHFETKDIEKNDANFGALKSYFKRHPAILICLGSGTFTRRAVWRATRAFVTVQYKEIYGILQGVFALFGMKAETFDRSDRYESIQL